MIKIKNMLLLLCLITFVPAPVSGADFEFKGNIKTHDKVSQLLDFYVKKFTPERLEMTVSGQPDPTGLISDIYMDLDGVKVGGVRLDKLTFRIHDAQFNAPENWASGDVECNQALQIYAFCHIKEQDINRRLEEQTFGDGDNHWKKISMQIKPEGLKGRGNYLAKVLFVTLDILIEIDSQLELVNYRELWLKNPLVKVNKMDLPDYITEKALSQVQPILDLNRFPLPMKLHNVILEDGSAALSTRTLPEPMTDGISYLYTAE